MKVIFLVTTLFFTISSYGIHPIFDVQSEWKDENSKTVKMSDFKGKNLVVTMSYTACKKTCPLTTMATLRKIEKYINENKIEAEFLVFSFDPEADTPEVMQQFKIKNKIESPHWHFLTGGVKETRELSKHLGLDGYWSMDDHVIHDFKISIFNKGQSLDRILDWDHREPDGLFK